MMTPRGAAGATRLRPQPTMLRRLLLTYPQLLLALAGTAAAAPGAGVHGASPGTAPTTCEQWGVWELGVHVQPRSRSTAHAAAPNPFVDVVFTAAFELVASGTATAAKAKAYTVGGFYDGGGVYRLRFSPPLASAFNAFRPVR